MSNEYKDPMIRIEGTDYFVVGNKYNSGETFINVDICDEFNNRILELVYDFKSNKLWDSFDYIFGISQYEIIGVDSEEYNCIGLHEFKSNPLMTINIDLLLPVFEIIRGELLLD